ncbi:PREDICTED: icarapin-like [Atta cephalotes]|uniref:Icarapin-like n=1 Tax=Atta cephalotes TaxID=12957 RepID=A0A158NXN8_ATTCE|nr:PREDICTED: icarapin-like [Atta cephalotes]XP_018054909.1 PREDICTED: icarapin-like [Atta colombica]
MKTFVQVLLVTACFVACTRSFPSSLGYDSSDEDDIETSFDFAMPNLFSDTINRIRQNFLNYFWTIPDMTNFSTPEGANTTSTVKIINGHVVTINETVYSKNDSNGGAVFRVRIIDVKPQNETEVIGGGSTEQPSVRSEPDPESRETVEEFNNEISKNTETLTA